jgi:hypothetical protein
MTVSTFVVPVFTYTFAVGSTTVTELTAGAAQLITTEREPLPTVPAPVVKPVIRTVAVDPATGAELEITRSIFPYASVAVVVVVNDAGETLEEA